MTALSRFTALASALGAAALLAACAAPPAGGDHDHAAGGGMGGMGAMKGMDAMGAMGGMHGMHDMHAGMQGMAVASLGPTQGQSVQGMVMFHAMADGTLMLHAHVTGLPPNTEHGFHIHENGSCASPDGSSAGGHFNPTAQPHGPQGAAHHAGDLPALKADAAGVADLKVMLPGLVLTGGPTAIAGRAVIVHANPDDYATQPTGNSGGRMACGVIAVHP